MTSLNGAHVLRWEVVRAAAAQSSGTAATPASTLTLQHVITLPDAGGDLVRCDRVDFPAGGEALTHVYQGPGIRCLLSGTIRIDAEARSHSDAPGQA